MSEVEVKTLITKAANAELSENAMKFSQAALNAANALSTLDYIKHEGNKRA